MSEATLNPPPVGQQSATLPHPGNNPQEKKRGSTRQEIHAAILECLAEGKPLSDGELCKKIVVSCSASLRFVREDMVKEGTIRPTSKVIMIEGKPSRLKHYEITPKGKELEMRLQYIHVHTLELVIRKVAINKRLRQHRDDKKEISAELHARAVRAARRRAAKE
jgi:predicted transcriptional regulator